MMEPSILDQFPEVRNLVEGGVAPRSKNDNKLRGEKAMIKENDRVKTLVEKEGFPAGTIGVVVSIYSEGPQCEVELWDADEYPLDVVTFSFDEIISVV